MEIGQIKIFKDTQELIEYYPYSNTKKDELGHKHFMIPLEKQIKSFKDGLGKIYFLETKENSHCHKHVDTGKYNYLVHSEVVRILNYELIDDEQDLLIKVEGYDDCILGVGYSFGQYQRLVYDEEKIILKLCEDMSREDAIEYFEYNIAGAYMGEPMPFFMRKKLLEEIEDLDYID